MNSEKLELVTDLYEFSMSNGYFELNRDEIAYFDIFLEKYLIKVDMQLLQV